MPKQISSFPAVANAVAHRSGAEAENDSGVQAVLGHWRRWLGDSRSLAAAALLAAVVAGGIVIILWTSGGQMVPLFGNQEQYDTSAIVEVLDAERIKFEIDSRSGNVLVSKDKIAAARMKLAARGVSAQLPVGMESLNGLSSLSTSQFMESNRYTYAVEGELARSIMSLRNVRNARVHLAVPKRTLFVGREEQTPSASVVVDLVHKLDESQVEAIVNMIAASVPGMKPGAVSVVDQSGKLLSAGLGENAPGRVSNKQMDYVLRLEEKVSRSASEMLEPMLGAENFRVRISADVDFSKIEETRETLGNEPVLLSETTMSDRATGLQALGIPGALANQPPVPPQPGAEGNAEGAEPQGSNREETNRRYGTGKAVTHTRSEDARIRKLSVSILVNDAVAEGGAWAPADLEKMREVVRAAAGIDPARGDTITLQSAPFVARVAPDGGAELPPVWQDLSYWENYIRYLVGALLFLLLIIFAVRPLVRSLTRETGRTIFPAAREEKLADEFEPRQAEADEPPKVELTGHQPAPAIGADKVPNRNVANLPPPGSELEVQLQHLRLLAEQETTRAAEVIKAWVHENGRKTS